MIHFLKHSTGPSQLETLVWMNYKRQLNNGFQVAVQSAPISEVLCFPDDT